MAELLATSVSTQPFSTQGALRYPVIRRIMGGQSMDWAMPLTAHTAVMLPTPEHRDSSPLQTADPARPAKISRLGLTRSPSQPLRSCPAP